MTVPFRNHSFSLLFNSYVVRESISQQQIEVRATLRDIIPTSPWYTASSYRCRQILFESYDDKWNRFWTKCLAIAYAIVECELEPWIAAWGIWYHSEWCLASELRWAKLRWGGICWLYTTANRRTVYLYKFEFPDTTEVLRTLGLSGMLINVPS